MKRCQKCKEKIKGKNMCQDCFMKSFKNGLRHGEILQHTPDPKRYAKSIQEVTQIMERFGVRRVKIKSK